jgi:ubiquinone/menaquinone biosynthesis C-methylase UbiE
MEIDYATIYRDHPEQYDALVSAEDCDGQLLPAIEGIAAVTGAHILEVGAGTGRITRQLLARGACVTGFDRALPMLEVARRRLQAIGETGWELHVADAEALPVGDNVFDVAIAGWVFGHLRSWVAERWRDAIGRCLDEMDRAVRPGGALIVVETLGTGTEVPEPPTEALAEYYHWLERTRGFARVALRTDYWFPDVETAARTTGFFFGSAFAERVRRAGLTRVPECTGLWSRTKGSRSAETEGATAPTEAAVPARDLKAQ